MLLSRCFKCLATINCYGERQNMNERLTCDFNLRVETTTWCFVLKTQCRQSFNNLLQKNVQIIGLLLQKLEQLMLYYIQLFCPYEKKHQDQVYM